MIFSGYGFGPIEKTFAGYSHFAGHSFSGEFPIAELRFWDVDFPGQVVMKAFNPFIPLNEDDSSIPCAMFDIGVENDTDENYQYAICLFVCSSFGGKQSKNEFWQENRISGILLGTDCLEPSDLDYGQICIATDARDISYQQYWFRGGWSDAVEMFWRDFTSQERFSNRVYEHNNSDARDTGLICSHFSVEAGGSAGSHFVISWNYPNRNNYWNPKADKTPWKTIMQSCFQTPGRAQGIVLSNGIDYIRRLTVSAKACTAPL
ncbi:MAG: GH116 family glycosyl-hydrolase [Clostridia bacterium]